LPSDESRSLAPRACRRPAKRSRL